MMENDVKVLLTDALQDYEDRTGLPRHQENLKNFADLFAVVNKTSGGVTAMKWLGSILTLAIATLSIVIAVKH